MIVENPTNDDTRGQVGIGTLIIFIAMVLVAAVAAGVLINTAGLLESSASDTASDSQAQVSNQVSVVSASAETTGSNSVDTLHFVVKKSPGSDDIDLEDLTINYQSDSEQLTLEQGASPGFTVNAEKETISNNVIDSTAERYRLTIDLTAGSLSAIDEGGEATVTFVDQSGASTIYGVNVPDTISGGSYVTV
jgi:flagellin-like protein